MCHFKIKSVFGATRDATRRSSIARVASRKFVTINKTVLAARTVYEEDRSSSKSLDARGWTTTVSEPGQRRSRPLKTKGGFVRSKVAYTIEGNRLDARWFVRTTRGLYI